jgi:cytochrome P450
MSAGTFFPGGGDTVRADPSVATVPLEAIDPNQPALLREPYAYFERLRNEAPVFRHPRTGVVSVSTYELVLEVNKKPRIYSSGMAHLLKSGGAGAIDPEEAAIMAQGEPWVNTMLTADPPAHTRYKKLAMKAFTQMRVDALGQSIEQAVHELIDRFARDGRVEFKSQFADHVPSIVVADMLGVPRDEIPQFQLWLRAAIARLAGGADRERRLDAARKEIELQRYLIRAIEDRRAKPRNDVISDLVHATLADEGDPRPLGAAELIGIIHQIFTAGQETTAQALSYAVYQLIVHPRQLAMVRADPALFPGVIEETLRHLTPTNSMWRIVKEDTSLGGVQLQSGDVLLLRYGSANRDDRKFPDAASFDITRANAKEHLAFGAGIHTCLGMALARKEMGIALPLVVSRLRNLRLRPEKSFEFAPSPLLRGVSSLYLEFDPA